MTLASVRSSESTEVVVVAVLVVVVRAKAVVHHVPMISICGC